MIIFLSSLAGGGNLFAGAWLLFTIDSLNLPERISASSSLIDSLDSSFMTGPELRGQMSNLKAGVVEELNFLRDYSQYLLVIPLYLILQGYDSSGYIFGHLLHNGYSHATRSYTRKTTSEKQRAWARYF